MNFGILLIIVYLYQGHIFYSDYFYITAKIYSKAKSIATLYGEPSLASGPTPLVLHPLIPLSDTSNEIVDSELNITGELSSIVFIPIETE